jgi:hypothetical protein
MSIDSYVNMSVDDLTTELNTLQTKRSKPKLQRLIDELIAYKRENPGVNTILQQLQQQTTLSRRNATTQPNLPHDLRQAYRSAKKSSASTQSSGKQSGGKQSSGKRKSRKSKKHRKSSRRR